MRKSRTSKKTSQKAKETGEKIDTATSEVVESTTREAVKAIKKSRKSTKKTARPTKIDGGQIDGIAEGNGSGYVTRVRSKYAYEDGKTVSIGTQSDYVKDGIKYTKNDNGQVAIITQENLPIIEKGNALLSERAKLLKEYLELKKKASTLKSPEARERQETQMFNNLIKSVDNEGAIDEIKKKHTAFFNVDKYNKQTEDYKEQEKRIENANKIREIEEKYRQEQKRAIEEAREKAKQEKEDVKERIGLYKELEKAIQNAEKYDGERQKFNKEKAESIRNKLSSQKISDTNIVEKLKEKHANRVREIEAVSADNENIIKLKQRAKLLREIYNIENQIRVAGKNERPERENALTKKRAELRELTKYFRETQAQNESVQRRIKEQNKEARERREARSAIEKDMELQEAFNKKVLEYKAILEDIANIEKQHRTGNIDKDSAKSEIDEKVKAGQEAYREIEKLSKQAGGVGNLGKQMNGVVQGLKDVKKEGDNAKGAIEKFGDAKKNIKELSLSFYNLAMSFVKFRAIAMLRDQFKQGLQYVREYYDGLNEIRIVTGKTEKESLKLGASFRQFSEKNSISSMDTVKSAVEFYRQGLNDTEVMERMESAVKYSKIAKLSLEQSSELITATVNSFSSAGVDARKAVDVFTYLGDASASGADEIGKSMQRVAGAAREFGVSFEWLGSYIATLSEKTRLSPEMIGTAMNSMLARLHIIRSKGFSEEDGTQLNEVSKALKNIGVELMTTEGEWRNYSDILNDIAVKWGGLSDRMKGYLATTMAGTRQQSYFLTLMNDLSKQTEGASRAVQLYEGSLKSAGNAEAKYAIYKESVTAAQDRMNLQLEKFYSMLQAGIIKDTFNLLGKFVEVIRKGTEATHGWNLKIIAGVAGLALVIGSIIKIKKYLDGIKKATQGAGSILGILGGGKLQLILVAIGAIISLVTVLTGLLNQNKKSLEDVNREFSELKDKVGMIDDKNKAKQQELDGLINKYKELSSKRYLTMEEEKQLAVLNEKLAGTSSELNKIINSGTEAYDKQSTVLKALNDEKERQNKLSALEKIKTIKEGIKKIGKYKDLDYGDTVDYYRRSGGLSIGKIMIRDPELQAIANKPSSYERGDEFLKLISDPKFLQKYADKGIPEIEIRNVAGKMQQYVWKKAKENMWYDLNDYEDATSSLNAFIDKCAGYVTEYNNTIEQIQSMAEEAFESQMEVDKLNPYVRIARRNSFRKNFSKEKAEEAYRGDKAEQYIYNAQGYKGSDDDNEVSVLMEKYKEAKDKGKELLAKSISEDLLTKYGIKVEVEFSIENLEPESRKLYRQIDESITRVKNKLDKEGQKIKPKAFNSKGLENSEQAMQRVLENLNGVEGTDEKSVHLGEWLLQIAKDAPEVFEEINKKYGATLQEMIDNPLLLKLFKVPEEVDEDGVKDYINKIKEYTQLSTEDGQKTLFSSLLGLENVETEEIAKEKLEQIMKIFEGTNYLDTFTKSLGGEGDTMMAKIQEFLNGTIELPELMSSIQRANETFSLNNVINEMTRANPEIAKYGQQLKDMAKATKDADIIGTHQGFNGVESNIDKVMHSLKALNTVKSEGKKDTDEYKNAVSQLENTFGEGTVSAENYGYMLEYIKEMAGEAIAPLDYLIDACFAAGNIDMSMTYGQLLALGEQALADQPALFSLKKALLDLVGKYGITIDINTTLSGISKAILPQLQRYTGKLGGSGGGGRRRGGGSGGGGRQKEQYHSWVKEQLEMIERQTRFDEFYLEQIHNAIERYKKKGEYTNAIIGTKQEIDIRKQNAQAIEGNISSIKRMLAQREADIRGMNRATESYKHAYDEIKELQDKLMSYTQKLENNADAMRELEKNIREYKRTIRQKKTDVENMILQAILDRENRRKTTLAGIIAMEKLILGVIKKRYEKERDEILATQKLKRQAFEEEKRKIDELLEKRKEAEKEQDKKKELENLQKSLVRISADPTRQKEKLALEKKIKALRDEMAWDSAEKQTKAQKESIDQQIKSLDDYVEYVEKYYEDLFKNPQKLIEEMKSIMQMSNAQIIEWLKQNFDEWNTYTENEKAQTLENWQNMLREMRGELQTYWKEVYDIMAQGDTAIIEFLKANSEEYRKASKLGAEAMRDEWIDKLNAVKDAFRQTAGEISKMNFKVYAPSLPSNSGGSGGSGGGSGGGGGNNRRKPKPEYKPKFTDGYTEWINQRERENQKRKQEEAKKQKKKYIKGTGNVKIKVKKHAQGGIADYTGLAWLDGTKQRPERVLSPEQTADFHSLLEGINEIKRYNVPNPLGIGKMKGKGSEAGVSIDGGINVYVQELAKDADFDEMAMRVKEKIFREISRNKPIGTLFG